MTDRRMPRDEAPRPLDRPRRGLRDVFAEFVFGMTGYEFARHALQTRAAMENLFLLVVVGDMIGVPVIPPFYSLGLLPYVVPSIEGWKRRVLRERELADIDEFDLHGV